MRHLVGDAVIVRTAGTHPGKALNAESVQTLTELGIDIGDEHPKPISDDLLADVSLIITVGAEAVVAPVSGVEIRTWRTDEPSERGIEGMERMRLVRDDLKERVAALVDELTIGQ